MRRVEWDTDQTVAQVNAKKRENTTTTTNKNNISDVTFKKKCDVHEMCSLKGFIKLLGRVNKVGLVNAAHMHDNGG